MHKKKVTNVVRLPEKTRRTLKKVVDGLSGKENVYGIGLFGSWSRGEATPSSDVDLFLLDKGNFSHEYVERIESNGLLIDIDHVPKKWVHSLIPPEIDQKLFEMQILYDRDWTLTNTKLLISKSYGTPERVGIRTEAHIMDSDIYLSRATSAYSRGDYRSAYLFATVALESALKVIIEIALEPFSNSHFIEKLESSTARLGMPALFKEYLEVSRLALADVQSIKDKLSLFRLVWEEFSAVTRHGTRELESSHFKVRTKLKYYLNPFFLDGAVIRTNALIASGVTAEASHYLTSIFLDLVESYAWLKSSIDKVKTDYTTLMRSLERLEEKNPRNYEQITSFLNLKDTGETVASTAIRKTRDTLLKIRRDRKVLIKNR